MKLKLLFAVLAALLPMYLVLIFIQTYGLNVPVDDQWYEPLELAIRVKDGTLQLSDITQEYSGHRAIFTHLMTVILTYLTDWYIPAELYIIFVLALLRFILMVLIFHEFLPQHTYIAIPIFAFLIFSPYQGYSWLSGIYSAWHFVSLFGLAAIWVLTHFETGWKPLMAGAVLASCATFSQGSGIITYPILALTLWMFGYRKWYHYGFWILAAAATLYFYLSGSGVAVGGETTVERTAINFQSLPTFLRFFTAFQGNVFAYRLDVNFPSLLGTFGMVILCANLYYLWTRFRNWKLLAPWITMTGYSFAISVIIFLTRYRNFLLNARVPRYVIVSTGFWIAVIATSILVLWHLREHRPRFLTFAYGLMAFILPVMAVPAILWTFQTTALEFGYPLNHHFNPPEDCIKNFAFYRQNFCMDTEPIKKSTEDDVYKLAYYGLGIFQDAQPIDLLPATPTDPLILDTPNLWMGVYLNRWYLGDMEKVLYIAPPATEPTAKIENLPDVLENYEDERAILDFIQPAQTVWYLHTRETAPNAEKMSDILEGFVYTPILIEDYRYGQEITLARYDIPPDSLSETYRFGESISMQGFSLLSEFTIRPCDTVRLKSWWKLTQPMDMPTSATLVVVNSEGEIIGRADAGLAYNLPMPLWETDKLYVDERVVQIDCDAAPGSYDLLFGMYTLNPTADLPIFLPDGAPIGTRAYLTTLTVTD